MYQFEFDDPVRHLTRIKNRLHTYVVQTFWHPLILPELPGKVLRNGVRCHLDCNLRLSSLTNLSPMTLYVTLCTQESCLNRELITYLCCSNILASPDSTRAARESVT